MELDKIDRVLRAASTAPMGIPPSDVGVVVFHGREKVRAFATDMAEVFGKSRWLGSPAFLAMLRPFMGKAMYEFLKNFVAPLVQLTLECREKGIDSLFYDAPAALLFHQSPYADPADSHIAATYAMIAAESMGLGGCLIGTVAPFMNMNKRVKAKYVAPDGNKAGIVYVLGYPAFHFQKGVRRRFASVKRV
ncbi:MAG: nitroreductase family protein [Nitrospinae bacterium]|nr:nitroreductase family protein [Nitrospinota bacterium]